MNAMLRLSSISVFVSLLGCAATHAETAHLESPFPGTHAVQARLAALPSPALPWTTPLATLTHDDVATLCRFEQASVSPRAVHAACANGRTVTVGQTGGFCDRDALADARVIGGRCAMTVGDLVACELALRENPCAMGRAVLPECAAFDACAAHLQSDAEVASHP